MSHDPTPAPADTCDDAFFEQVDAPEVLDWVRTRSEATLAAAGDSTRFRTLEAEARAILDATDRLAWVQPRGGFAYNFWRDAEHQRGIWRRMPLARYLELGAAAAGSQEWDVLLDVDALATAESENWVYSGTVVHRPADARALCRLSRGGADAVVVREFDLQRGRLVPPAEGGFWLPEAKTDASWADADTLLVSSPLGAGQATDSGYGRTVRLLRRGADLAQAPVIWSCEPGDVACAAHLDAHSGRLLASTEIDFHTSRRAYRPAAAALRPDAEGWRELPLPGNCRIASCDDMLLLLPRTDFSLSGVEVPAGGVAALSWDAVDAAFETAESGAVAAPVLPAPEVLFAPTADQALESLSFTGTGALLEVGENMTSRLMRLTAPTAEHGWRCVSLLPEDSTGDWSVLATDPFHDSGALLATSSPIEPTALVQLTDDDQLRQIAQTPARFAATSTVVERFRARSEDGTQVPYFVIRRTDLPGPRPTILYGYGGFQISQKPTYGALRGKGWVERGGTYVVAGIRGGGEYGPAWHQAALRDKRPRAFEDMAAVARDLVARGMTTASTLGMTGGSNGGLLAGVMLTRYPELFGAVAISVPLLDMRRYHLLLAGASWMAEYGDPDSADWDFISAYSPLHNVRGAAEVRYPPALVMTSTRDDRVHPAHARKMVAALEAAGQDVRYFENIEGGHAGAADNAQEARRTALLYWFFAEQLGLSE